MLYRVTPLVRVLRNSLLYAMNTTYPPFLDLPPEMRDPATARYRILPVPFDATSTFRKGADRGPLALLEVSDQLEEYDIETGTEPCRAGIFVDEPVSCDCQPEEMVEEVQVQDLSDLRH